MVTQATYPVVGTQLVACWFSANDKASCPVLLTGNESGGAQLLLNWGPSQHPAALQETTIGALRDEWGDDSVGGDLHPLTRCWHYTNNHDGQGVTVVLVRMPLLAGWGDEVPQP